MTVPIPDHTNAIKLKPAGADRAGAGAPGCVGGIDRGRAENQPARRARPSSPNSASAR
nr:hypothetical protein [Mesorhizobium camelthorni]